MRKSIVIVAGKEKTGKSSAIKMVWDELRRRHPSSTFHLEKSDGDILACITIGKVKIGIESQGDPGSRIFNTLELLMDSKHSKLASCDIIVCASRTRGKVKTHISNLSNRYDYRRLWNGAPITSTHNIVTKNKLFSKFILSQIDGLIAGTL